MLKKVNILIFVFVLVFSIFSQAVLADILKPTIDYYNFGIQYPNYSIDNDEITYADLGKTMDIAYLMPSNTSKVYLKVSSSDRYNSSFLIRIYDGSNQLLFSKSESASNGISIGSISLKTYNVPGAHKVVIISQSQSLGLNGTVRINDIEVLTSDIIPPAVPTGLSATSLVESVSLNWDDNIDSDLSGYNVYVNSEKVNTDLILSSDYIVSNLVANTNYAFQVSAVDSFGNESEKSSVVYAVAYPELISPVLSYSDLDHDSIRLIWDDSLSSYEILKDGVTIGTTTYGFYDITGLSPSTTYIFTLVSTDKYGRTISTDLTVETPQPSLLKPSFTIDQVKHDSARLNISSQDFVDTYEIFLDNSLIYTSSDLTYNLTSLSPETIYSVKVKAINSYSSSENTLSFTTAKKPQPEIITASVSSGGSGGSLSKTLTYEPNELVSEVEVFVDGVSIGIYPSDQREIELDFSTLQDLMMADIEIVPTDEDAVPYSFKTPVKSTGSDAVDSILEKFMNAFSISKNGFLYLEIASVFLTIAVILFFWLRNKFKGLFGKTKNYHGEAKDLKSASVRKSQRNRFNPQSENLNKDNPADQKRQNYIQRSMKKQSKNLNSNNRQPFEANPLKQDKAFRSYKNKDGFNVVKHEVKNFSIGFMGSQGYKTVHDLTYEKNGVQYKQKYVKGKGKIYQPKDFENQKKHMKNQYNAIKSVAGTVFNKNKKGRGFSK